MIKGIKIAMKENKWNLADCGRCLAISEDGLIVTKEPFQHESTFTSVRANLPFPPNNGFVNKPKIAFYFEVEILKKIGYICIGFCTRKFPLESSRRWLGQKINSIGIYLKELMKIENSFFKFRDDTIQGFYNGDIVGIGIIHKPNSTMECFATCNGELLGKIELQPKFATLKLFPAVSIYRASESIRANFGKEQFRFKDFKLVLEMECNTFIEEEESGGSDHYASDYDYLSEEDENIDENDDN